VAARSKAWIGGHWVAGIVGSNAAGDMMSVCCKCCVVRYRSVRRTDHWPRGLFPSMVHPVSVIVKPREGRP
jgi:hypothetical protein